MDNYWTHMAYKGDADRPNEYHHGEGCLWFAVPALIVFGGLAWYIIEVVL